jgi:hypothetical protein
MRAEASGSKYYADDTQESGMPRRPSATADDVRAQAAAGADVMPTARHFLETSTALIHFDDRAPNHEALMAAVGGRLRAGCEHAETLRRFKPEIRIRLSAHRHYEDRETMSNISELGREMRVWASCFEGILAAPHPDREALRTFEDLVTTHGTGNIDLERLKAMFSGTSPGSHRSAALVPVWEALSGLVDAYHALTRDLECLMREPKPIPVRSIPEGDRQAFLGACSRCWDPSTLTLDTTGVAREMLVARAVRSDVTRTLHQLFGFREALLRDLAPKSRFAPQVRLHVPRDCDEIPALLANLQGRGSLGRIDFACPFDGSRFYLDLRALEGIHAEEPGAPLHLHFECSPLSRGVIDIPFCERAIVVKASLGREVPGVIVNELRPNGRPLRSYTLGSSPEPDPGTVVWV